MKRINNKGFTLIEVIGIVVILVAIFLIAFPSLLGITKKEEEKIYTVMLDDLCLAGESYIYSNMDKFPQLSTPNSTIKLKISTLVEYGNISKNTVNSKTDKSVINEYLLSYQIIPYLVNIKRMMAKTLLLFVVQYIHLKQEVLKEALNMSAK